MDTSSDIAISFVTCPAEHAAALARTLVGERPAACVNLVPGLQSVFLWQGKLDHADETLLLIKHPLAGFEALRRRVVELHPYELPEVVAVPVSAVHLPYRQWILDECRASVS